MAMGSFYFWHGLRQLHIDEHNFYIVQAKKRLLSSFENLEEQAHEFADNWFHELNQQFNHEFCDRDAILERGYEESIEHYISLNNLKKQAYLSVLSGMFHQFDKAVRNWLAKEMEYISKNGENTRLAIWMKDFPELINLMDGLGYQISQSDFCKELLICHLVVNVYKHGRGKSFERLMENRPEYFTTKYDNQIPEDSRKWFISHDRLEIKDEEIELFSNAIVAFWNFIPENVYFSQIVKLPEWLEKAIEKDIAAKNGFIRIS